MILFPVVAPHGQPLRLPGGLSVQDIQQGSGAKQDLLPAPGTPALATARRGEQVHLVGLADQGHQPFPDIPGQGQVLLGSLHRLVLALHLGYLGGAEGLQLEHYLPPHPAQGQRPAHHRPVMAPGEDRLLQHPLPGGTVYQPAKGLGHLFPDG